MKCWPLLLESVKRRLICRQVLQEKFFVLSRKNVLFPKPYDISVVFEHGFQPSIRVKYNIVNIYY